MGVGNLMEDNQIEYKQTATNEDLVINRLIDLKYDLCILEELDIYDDWRYFYTKIFFFK